MSWNSKYWSNSELSMGIFLQHAHALTTEDTHTHNIYIYIIATLCKYKSKAGGKEDFFVLFCRHWLLACSKWIDNSAEHRIDSYWQLNLGLTMKLTPELRTNNGNWLPNLGKTVKLTAGLTIYSKMDYWSEHWKLITEVRFHNETDWCAY